MWSVLCSPLEIGEASVLEELSPCLPLLAGDKYTESEIRPKFCRQRTPDRHASSGQTGRKGSEDDGGGLVWLVDCDYWQMHVPPSRLPCDPQPTNNPSFVFECVCAWTANGAIPLLTWRNFPTFSTRAIEPYEWCALYAPHIALLPCTGCTAAGSDADDRVKKGTYLFFCTITNCFLNKIIVWGLNLLHIRCTLENIHKFWRKYREPL